MLQCSEVQLTKGTIVYALMNMLWVSVNHQTLPSRPNISLLVFSNPCQGIVRAKSSASLDNGERSPSPVTPADEEPTPLQGFWATEGGGSSSASSYLQEAARTGAASSSWEGDSAASVWQRDATQPSAYWQGSWQEGYWREGYWSNEQWQPGRWWKYQ